VKGGWGRMGTCRCRHKPWQKLSKVNVLVFLLYKATKVPTFENWCRQNNAALVLDESQCLRNLFLFGRRVLDTVSLIQDHQFSLGKILKSQWPSTFTILFYEAEGSSLGIRV
jgi:hypothetical protein